MLHQCRICRTRHNLKYAPKQLLNMYKNHTGAENEIFGNICFECEERLLNFNKVSDEPDDEADSGREETPIIVDDDELLYNLYFDKMPKTKQQQQTHHLKQPSSLGSDGDTEIIEAITSRESTPESLQQLLVQKEENEHLKFTESGKTCKRRKNYADSELIVLATLNLVSSDSEADEIFPPAKRHSNNQTKAELSAPQPLDIGKCESVANTRDHVNCALCKLTFSCKRRLVHHMRVRHRSQEHETELRERARHAHDSALTIRLCYQALYTYYECQLCGQIDYVYKEHKQHVIAQHEAELKSLKDPLLKQLQCPLCQTPCGSQNIELCRHLLTIHTPMQYKPHLRQMQRGERVAALSASQQSEAECTARIFLFHKHQHYYFECRQCRKVCSRFSAHRNHIKQADHIVQPKANVESKKLEKTKPIAKKIVEERKTRASKKPKITLAAPPLLTKTLRKRKEKAVVQPKAIRKPSRKSKSNPTLLQLPTLNYNCAYCALQFKGFCQLNWHLLQAHSEQEFQSCEKLSAEVRGQRRKRIGGNCMIIDENSNAAKSNCCKPLHNSKLNEMEKKCVQSEELKILQTTNTADNNAIKPIWLEELLVLSAQHNNNKTDYNQIRVKQETKYCRSQTNADVLNLT